MNIAIWMIYSLRMKALACLFEFLLVATKMLIFCSQLNVSLLTDVLIKDVKIWDVKIRNCKSERN